MLPNYNLCFLLIYLLELYIFKARFQYLEGISYCFIYCIYFLNLFFLAFNGVCFLN